jgi:hypothetical protein
MEKGKGMKLPKKREIVAGVQFFIMIYTMVMGFWYSYLWVWLKVGLPGEWWSSLLAMALALASVFGFGQWVKKS